MTVLKKFTQLAATLLGAAVLTACGNADTAAPDKSVTLAEVKLEALKAETAAIADMTPMQLMENATMKSNQLADVLAAVKDEASAEVAIAEMRALGPQLKAVGARLETLNEDDIKLSIKTMKTMQSFAEAQMRVFNETGRIAADHPELRDTIMAGFEDIEINFQ